MDRIYADNAATTKISHKAMEAMVSSMENTYGNPSSLHQIGMEANDALQTAREQIARCLGCTPKEIYFTSGGTESDNQAIISAAMLDEKQNKKHIISTAFEHHAVLYTLRKLKEQGFEVELLDAGEEILRQNRNRRQFVRIHALLLQCLPIMRLDLFFLLLKSVKCAVPMEYFFIQMLCRLLDIYL